MAATWCGLICCPPPGQPPKEQVPVPLKSVSVHADVRGWTVAVTAELTYLNSLSEAIECQFVFPLSDKSAVHRLEADIAGKKLTAECRPRKEAEETYRDAVDSGHAGVLLENQQGSPDVFRIMLGNLPPNQEAKVTIGFVQSADRDTDGVLTVTLPTVLNPRYVPKHMITDPEKMKEHFHLRVPYVSVSEVSYTMKFGAKINLGVNALISEVSSVNTADVIKTTFEQNKQVAVVELEGKFVQDHDFGLKITPADPFKPMVFIEPGQPVADASKKNWLSYDIAAAWFEPEVNKDKAPGAGIAGDEYWLVIDRSGSMDGDKIKHAKTALVLFVKSLPVGCKFNIVGFGSTFLALFPEGSVNYSEKTIAKAVQHSNELEADLGGTEILEPLKYIYDQPKPTSPGARQFIVLLTDGEVGNTDEVIAIAGKNTARLFTIGIGEGASTALVNGMARVSGGVSEFVRSANDRLQAKVISLLKASTNPAAEKIQVNWNVTGGKLISLLPDKIPTAAYQGRPIMQYALIERHVGNNVDGTASLTASVSGKPVDHKLNFGIPSSVSSPAGDSMPLHRLAAKAKIQELADQQNPPDFDALKKELTAISVATGVLCQETAFVAVDPDTKAELKDKNGRPRFIDIERPTSYPIMQHRMMFCAAMPMPMMRMAACAPPPPPPPGAMMMEAACDFDGGAPPPPPMRKKRTADQSISNMEAAPMDRRREDICDDDSADYFEASDALEMARPEKPKADGLDILVRHQNFNGSWPLNADLVNVLASSKTPDEASIRKETSTALAAKQVTTVNDELIATLIVLVLLRRRFSSRQEEWELIEQKAVAFLRSKLSVKIDELVDSIASAIGL